MKKLPVHFTITVPITHFNTLPPIHVGDVEVQAIAYQYADGSMLLDDEDERPEVDIDAILFNGNNITGLIEAVAPDYYESLKVAAGEHAKKFANELAH